MKSIFFAVAIAVTLYGCKQQAPTDTKPVASTNSTTPPPTPKASAKTYDGPFGLAGGIPIAELERLGFKAMSERPELFTGTPPKPLTDAENYAVMATPSSGVCRIMARVPVAVVNGTGDQLKEKADSLAEIMKVKYGKYSSKVEYVKQDVYRRNPQFWLMGLREDSVVYAYDWESGKTDKPLPNDLEDIEIDTGTSDTDSGYVMIKYTYKNFANCRKDREASKANNL